MTINELLLDLQESPRTIAFRDVIKVIDTFYHFKETAFINGSLQNKAGQNNGSCKIFSFAQLHQLSAEKTLACFGDFYFKDVLLQPSNDDHQNIRQFMQNGWAGIKFEAPALTTRAK